ncbi:hypothetical protein [Listeria booriae]|uniref:hypothetical protein n=1 Tax=Listeria booriae TaxID=1552123 RepID=UPI00162AE37D|nr:hypothetical protein [Listeria booriae]MBC1983469.1 hypothetical protein [Listeria booriae]
MEAGRNTENHIAVATCALWTMLSSFKTTAERADYTVYRGANGFTASLYFTIESLIAFDGRHYEKYGKFNEKERVQIIRAFTNWALEQEGDE